MIPLLYRLTGWRIFRPSRTAWGESTAMWSDVDWDWYHRKQRPTAEHPRLKTWQEDH